MYKVLDRDVVCDYLRSIPEVMEVLGSADSLEVAEIGDGNLNFVYRVTNLNDTSRSVILKQAVPYLRMVGEEWPLGRDRMTYEIRALTVYNQLVPSFVPSIHHADESMSTLIMQCLDNHIILRHGLIAGKQYPDVGCHIGKFLAETLFRTSAFSMDSQARRQLMDRFTLNAELCQLTEEFIFTFPYMEHPSNYSNSLTDQWAQKYLRDNSEYKLNVLKFKELFITKTDALLHADLHTGSFMVNQLESYVIDMEFSFFGPFGFDIGKIMANFWMCATSHLHRSADHDMVDWLVDQTFVIWKVFSSQFFKLWDGTTESAMLIPGLLSKTELNDYKRSFMQKLLQETVGFAACCLARRTLGIAGVADIRDIEELEIRSKLEIINLELSMLLMKSHDSVEDINDVATLISDFYRAQPNI
ncbi:MAG: S-methyl-5-thioribose kinase [Cyanobacteria bacterium P01_D01_bin.56]